MFWRIFDNAFGLDISDLSVKVVQLRNVSFRSRHPRFRIRAWRSIELPPGLIVNGELQQPEEVRKKIQQLLAGTQGKQRPIKGYWVVASVPETQGFIKLIHTDTDPRELSRDDIVSLAKRHIPFAEEEYYLDWQMIIPKKKDEDDAQEYTLLIGATPKKVADAYTYLLEALGLGVIAFENESVAIARAMITASKEYTEEARLVLDMGATGTRTLVYDHDTIQFSSQLAFSGELLTTAIAQKLNIPHDEAEKKKVDAGIAFSKSPLWPIVTQQIDALAADLKTTIDFYYAHFPKANRITHITLCGGCALLADLPDVLTQKLGIETKPGNPWKNISPNQKDALPPGLELAPAIGLALRAADNPLLTHDRV
jgi:type IV pilus assembly protein PilM